MKIYVERLATTKEIADKEEKRIPKSISDKKSESSEW